MCDWNREGVDRNYFNGLCWLPGLFAKDLSPSLDIQIPSEDRCLNPQTSPFRRLLRVPNTYSPGMTGGFWKTRASGFAPRKLFLISCSGLVDPGSSDPWDPGKPMEVISGQYSPVGRQTERSLRRLRTQVEAEEALFAWMFLFKKHSYFILGTLVGFL